MKHPLGILLTSFCLLACLSELATEPDVFVDFEPFDYPSAPLSDSSKAAMNGIYDVIEGKDILGPLVAGQWIGNRWCILSQHDVVYAETAGGMSGDSIKLLGYIRTVRSGSGTRVKLKVLPQGGAKELISGGAPPAVAILGATDDGKTIHLRWKRNLYTSGFQILAHRGGGRNAERLGISENSIEMINLASILGATGIEIDIKRTKDDEIIVFHDDEFSPRTVQGIYLLGPVQNFKMDQVRQFGRLIHGEKIPTLEEALTFVIEHTHLSLVWLDLKDPQIIDRTIQLQNKAMSDARAAGRDITILLGIPTRDILDAYTRSPLKHSSDILVELEASIARTYPTCKVWAPRWTNNITASEIAQIRQAGKQVFTWTVDVRESIIDYLGRVDGILTNYPSLVAGIHASQE